MSDCGGATVMDDLPEWLVVADILVRLPAKDVLRCRAVRKSWRSGTTTDAFILAHHRRQPSLPVVEVQKGICRIAGDPGDRKANNMKRSTGVTTFDNLHESLVVDEILARLPPKDVLRCRAVRKSWRSCTSTDEFIFNNHRCQPSLPIIEDELGVCRVVQGSNDLKIQPVICAKMQLHASCDGFLILSRMRSDFYICNPSTRKCASLPYPPPRPNFSSIYIFGFQPLDILGFYRHHPSGEHRVLWVSYSVSNKLYDPVELHDFIYSENLLPDYYVLTVGSTQPRCIQWPTVSEQKYRDIIATSAADCPPVHHCGSLHWLKGLNITVFDTVAETFHQMSHPAQLDDKVSLLDVGEALAMCHTRPDCATLDVWVLQDYDAETWGFLYRIDLFDMDASPPINWMFQSFPRMALINDRELLIEQHIDRLLHCDIDGEFLGNVEGEEHLVHRPLTRHCLQESMISLPLFETQEEEDVHEELSFFI